MSAKRPSLIVVCVDLKTVGTIVNATSRSYDLLWARDINAIRTMLDSGAAPHALLIDNAVPQIAALEVLQIAQKSHGQVKRVLISDYCDLSLIVQGLHTGAVERIVYKPITSAELIAALGTPAGAVRSSIMPPANRAAG
ncbi:MAG TPA: hypothetical protein VHD56_17300 [Tepidisphaeraceae bacterium]|nr:hypothetical protein [Tepidisphaeraceae bacterium]